MPSVFILPSAPFFLQLITVLIIISSLLSALAPSFNSRVCLDNCKLHKPVDFDGPFAINCSNGNFSEEQQNRCESDCRHFCRHENMCNVDEDYHFLPYTATINCPANSTTIPEIDCQSECDSHRPIDSDGPYLLHCNDLNDSSEKRRCKLICISCEQFCEVPEIERDSRDTSIIINCPSAVLSDGSCKQRCDYQRNVRNDSFLGNFTFDCANYTLFPTKWDQRVCLKDCDDCPYTICLRRRDYLYDENEHGEFSCPAVKTMPPRPPSRPTEPVYEGSNCEKRCEKGRAYERRRDGERDSYFLSCGDERYGYNEEEKQQCFDDCSSCPLDVCDPVLDMDYNPNPDYGHNPEFAYDSQPNPYYGKHVTFRCPDSRPTPTPERAKPGRYIVAWVIIALVAVAIIACIVSAVMYGRVPSVGDIIGRGANPPAPKSSHGNADSAFNSHCSMSNTLVSSVSLQPPAP